MFDKKKLRDNVNSVKEGILKVTVVDNTGKQKEC